MFYDSQYTNDGDIISKPEDNEKKLENYKDVIKICHSTVGIAILNTDFKKINN